MNLDVNPLESLYHRTVALRKEFVAALRANPQVVDPSLYTFIEHGATKNLADLFGDQRDLVVIHNMGKQCKYCTLWADGLNGLLRQITSRTAMVVMNADDPAVQHAVAAERGWNHRMVHDAGGAFAVALGFGSLTDGKLSLTPGYSSFYKDTDGTITRIGFDFFGPGDMYMPVFPMFELLKDGANGWQP